MECPICQGVSTRLFSQYGYWIRQCQKCGFQFAELTPSKQHTQQVYSDEYFQGGKAGYPDYLKEATLLRNRGRYYSRILKRYLQPETILDVGAAAGFILQGFLDSGWQGKGLEPNPSMAYYGSKHLGLDIEVGTLENFSSEQRYQVISMIQLVAHFGNLQTAFQVAAQVTQPQGFWLIETWNRRSLTAKVMGKHWHEYSPPSVLHWFSPQDLQSLAQQFGFREIARGRPLKLINGAHAKSLLQYKLQESSLGRLLYPILKIIPDSLTIPYPAEDLFYVLFQKQ